MRRTIQLTLTIGLAIVSSLTVLISLSGLAFAADQCASPGGAGGCFATIQAAIDAANSGDTVSVVAGTYAENIVITKDLTLLGGFDDTSLTSRTPRSSLIDGSGVGTVISITNSAEVTVEGFTISGGNATTNGGDSQGDGGGISIDTAIVTIVDNLIENNIASDNPSVGGDGGGIYATRSTVVITGNTIQLNRAYSVTTGSEYGAGGGVAFGSANNAATIVNNEILSNTAAALTTSSSSAEGYGGGINCSGEQLMVEGNTIRNNLTISAGPVAYGGGINIFRTLVVTITNNVIANNTGVITGTADAGGGAVSAGGFSGTGRRLVLIGNRIMSNTTMVNGAGTEIHVSGGLNLFGDNTSDDSVILQDNAIVGNVSVENAVSSGGAADGFIDGAGVRVGAISDTQIIGNNISNNTVMAGSDGTWIGGTGGAVHLDSSGGTILIMNNNISGNSSEVSVNVWESVVTSTNNTVANNSGIGLRVGGSDPPSIIRVINDTFYNNGVAGIQSYALGTQVFVTNTIVVSHNLGLEIDHGSATLIGNFNLLDNTTNYDSGITPGSQDITGQDPKFVDAANGDFHLADGSPAIGKGTSVGAPVVDFENQARPQGSGIDIGADEVMPFVEIAPATGGTLVYTDTQDSPTTVQVPEGAVSEATRLTYVPVEKVASPSGFFFADHSFTLEAYRNGTILLPFVFEKPITVTIYYTNADIAGVSENELALRYWDGTEWSSNGITLVERNTEQNYVIFTIAHLSKFAVFGPEAPVYKVYIPVVLK